MMIGLLRRIAPIAVSVLLVFALSAVAHATPPDPLAPGPFSTAITVIDEGCSYDLDGVSLVWSDPTFGFGPTTVIFGDNDFGGSDTRCPGNPAVLVDMKARVHYPGAAGVVAPGGPFPFVLFLHGQQSFSIPGYEGYDYIASLLASHGFIVASIDGRSLLDSTIKSRGEHIREHLRRFVNRNKGGSGSFLSGQLDMTQTAVVGHSRGGDAVAAAWEWQRVAPDPGYAIKAIVAIAPVQFFGRIGGEPTFISHIRDVAYQILHGSHDCDVSDFQGLREYDRAASIPAVGQTPKSMVFIKDSNHNFFNTVWETLEGSECGGGSVLSGPVVRNVAKVYIHSFLEVIIKGDTSYRGYLTGTFPDPVAGTQVVLDYQAPSAEFEAVDSFEELTGVTHSKKRNTLGGRVHGKSITYGEEFFSAIQPVPLSSYKGETWAAHLQWASVAASLTSKIPAGDSPPPALTHLSFRVGQVFRTSGSPNPPGADQDFRVRLKSKNGASAVVKVSDFARIVSPFPALVGGTKTVPGVVRIPLSAFAGVDLNNLKFVRFEFSAVATGEIMVDDIRFTTGD